MKTNLMTTISMILKKITLLLSLLICISCAKRELVKTISSQDLISLDYKNIPKIDSLTGYVLLKENPAIFNWSGNLDLLKKTMPEDYLSENLDYEKDKAIKYFLRNNNLFSYSYIVNNEEYKGVIAKSVSEPDEWLDKGFYLKLFLIEGKNKLEEPVLLNSYVHLMGITSWESSSKTEFYSDQSIKVKIKNGSCSDVIMEDKIACDSTSIVNFYIINFNSGKVKTTSETIRYDYEM